MIPRDFDENLDKRDIVLQMKFGKLHRIHECHVSYLALQYPLLLPKGEDGHRLGIKQKHLPKHQKERRSTKMLV